MKQRASITIFAVVILVLGVLFLNCQDLKTIRKTGDPSKTVDELQGNGGGYSGIDIEVQEIGEFAAPLLSVPDGGESVGFEYFRFTENYFCTDFFGENIFTEVRKLYLNQNEWWVTENRCSDRPATLAGSEPLVSAYNPDFLVFEESAFERYVMPPNLPSDLLQIVALCRRTEFYDSEGLDFGLNVVIKKNFDEAVTAQIFQGKKVGSSNIRTVSKPFAVSRSIDTNLDRVNYNLGDTFNLQISEALGQLSMIFDGQEIAQELECYPY